MTEPNTANSKPPDEVLNPGQALLELREEVQTAHPDMAISDVNRLIAPGLNRAQMATNLAAWLRTRPKKQA